jgi:SNF2 family DNA or RNA helicase
MNVFVDELDADYRKFDEDNLPYSFSSILLSPVLRIESINGKYSALLGANVKKGNEVSFIPCLSQLHNWIQDGERIKPLPYDAPSIVHEAISDDDIHNLKFQTVLILSREGIDGVELEITPSVFEKANIRSLSMSLNSGIPKLNAKLYGYQVQGVAWINSALESVGGVILADEMGLGKTIQIISVLLLKEPINERPALIVCTTTLIANWCREITRFAPTLTFIVHRGSNRTGFYKDLMRSQVVITTYDTLINDTSLFHGIDWEFLICDEAQAAKNPESQRRQVLGDIPRRYTIPVTGTPMENTLMDLWSLGDLAIPGMLGDREAFSSRYPDTELGAIELSYIFDTIILKRQVKDVANDLPERTDIDFPVELEAGAELEYIRIKEEAIAEYGAVGKLVAVGQLALYCAHPWLRIKNPEDPNWEDNVELNKRSSYSLLTPKMEVCIQLLKEAFMTGKKVLIFAAYNHCGELIKKASIQKVLPTAYWDSINGSTPQADRQTIVDQFSQYVGPAVLVLNPKAAGAGLNITAATVVIHYTQNWNPALEMQASARAHRRGQCLPVTVYRLYYQGTVEETMVERSRWKRELGAMAVPISSRDKEDIEDALKINPLVRS